MYQDKKFEIRFKLIEINDIIDDLNITSSEYEDIRNIINNANLILNGRYDSYDYMIQESQIDQCMNSLNNLIYSLKKRKK